MKGSKENENKYLIDGQTRMSLIKKILIEEIIPTIEYASNVIVRTFRVDTQVVNNQRTDEVKTPCIYSSIFDKHRLINLISSLPDPPGGGTPIAQAINEAIVDLQKFPNHDRKIVLLTDGEENAGGDYKEAARKALALQGIL